jgi:hypothetical protein
VATVEIISNKVANYQQKAFFNLVLSCPILSSPISGTGRDSNKSHNATVDVKFHNSDSNFDIVMHLFDIENIPKFTNLAMVLMLINELSSYSDTLNLSNWNVFHVALTDLDINHHYLDGQIIIF